MKMRKPPDAVLAVLGVELRRYVDCLGAPRLQAIGVTGELIVHGGFDLFDIDHLFTGDVEASYLRTERVIFSARSETGLIELGSMGLRSPDSREWAVTDVTFDLDRGLATTAMAMITADPSLRTATFQLIRSRRAHGLFVAATREDTPTVYSRVSATGRETPALLDEQAFREELASQSDEDLRGRLDSIDEDIVRILEREGPPAPLDWPIEEYGAPSRSAFDHRVLFDLPQQPFER